MFGNPSLGMAICLAAGLMIVLFGAGLQIGTALRRGETLKAAVFGTAGPESPRKKPHAWLLAVGLTLLLTGGFFAATLFMSGQL